MMRWLTIAVLAAGLLWSGYWFVGRAAVARGADAAIEAARAEGWHVEYEALAIRGFPNRFDLTLDAPNVSPPGGAWRWTAPFAQVLALSYRPTEVIAVVADRQTFDTPLGAVNVTTGDLRASATIRASTEPDLREGVMVGEGLTATGDGWTASLERLQVAFREAVDGGRDVSIDLDRLDPSGLARAMIDPEGILDGPLDQVRIDMTVEGDEAVELRRASLVWGDLHVTLRGAMTRGATGAFDGTFDVELVGWETALALVEAAELVSPARVPLLRAGFAAMDDGDGSIGSELTIVRNAMRLGILPLGSLPQP